MLFLAPLDHLLWDRRAVEYIFGFRYVWEVYKRAPDRLWGYYVLPVFYRDRFVGRIDSRLEGRVWRVSRWWWEEDAHPTPEMLDALQDAARRFIAYLGAESVAVDRTVEAATRAAILHGGRG